MEDFLNPKKLDEIIKQTLGAIENGKEEIFDISETARNEVKKIEDDLNLLKIETQQIMKNLEEMEHQLAVQKHRLMHVNKNFSQFSEEELKQAYENTDKLMVEVAITREREKYMIQRRNDMEIRHKNSTIMIEKSEKLISQISVVFDYLAGNLKGISDKVEGIVQKQGLGPKIIKAQEEERQRVARDIHDGPAQLMANVVLKAEICEKLIDIDIEKTKEELNNLKKVVRESLQDVRRIIYDLRPMSLDDLGLVPTVQRYAATFSEGAGIETDIETKGNLEDLTSLVSLTAFRIIQESLNNVKKHSKATLVKIKLESKDEKLIITILDNGVGFDVANTKKDHDDIQGGFGLYSMNERLELLDGTMEIISEKNKGTKLIVSVPKQLEEGV